MVVYDRAADFCPDETTGRCIGSGRTPVAHTSRNYAINSRSFALLSALLLTSATASADVRTIEYTYLDDTSKWVLGQVASEREVTTGTVISQTTYDASSRLPIRVLSFGALVAEYGYNANGTLAWSKDGAGNQTKYADWLRGHPRTVTQADGSTLSATVSSTGLVTSTTDQAGSKTLYEYDAMARLRAIYYPKGDTVVWHGWTSTFRQMTSTDVRPAGIGEGHWIQHERQGYLNTVTYFDALWRPLLKSQYDETNKAGMIRTTAYRYDNLGRTAFTAYPTATDAGGTTGIWTEYDALGRVISVSQDSELGLLTTTTHYSGDGGYSTIVTDPRGAKTLTWYQTFEQPSTDLPVSIMTAEGAITDIPRDVFGKPISIQRRSAPML